MTIAICTPTRDLVHAGFAFDLFNLANYHSHEYNLVFLVSKGTLLCNQRTDLVKQSLDMKASYVLFIDSDMRFPVDTLRQLLHHNLNIVGANCIQRGTDKSTAQNAKGFVSSKGATGIEEVEHLGFGVTLIATDVFKKIPQPWFATPYDGEHFVGEDIFFCHKAKECHFKIFIDHDLSKQIKHVGNYEYGMGSLNGSSL